MPTTTYSARSPDLGAVLMIDWGCRLYRPLFITVGRVNCDETATTEIAWKSTKRLGVYALGVNLPGPGAAVFFSLDRVRRRSQPGPSDFRES